MTPIDYPSPVYPPQEDPPPSITLPFPDVPIPSLRQDPKLRIIIGNWNSINNHIKTRPSMEWYEVAINLESQRPGGPRRDIIERLYAKWVKHHRARVYAALQIPNSDPGV